MSFMPSTGRTCLKRFVLECHFEAGVMAGASLPVEAISRTDATPRSAQIRQPTNCGASADVAPQVEQDKSITSHGLFPLEIMAKIQSSFSCSPPRVSLITYKFLNWREQPEETTTPSSTTSREQRRARNLRRPKKAS
jgi:hypothetical protein